MAPTNRLRTTNNSRHEDHISNLPLDVVSDILSRLPINDAVKTSVLSRNWKCKWTSIYEIDISPDISKSFKRHDDEDTTFFDVVTRLLDRTKNSRLKTFRLSCFYHSSYIEKYMSDVLMRNVQNLNLCVSYGLNSEFCFSGWGLLTELKLEILEMGCTLILPVNNCFPNLKYISLGGGDDEGLISIRTTVVPDNGRVILVFPVLEVFRLRQCQWLDVSSVEIQAPELISFSSRCSGGEYKMYEINICGPKLVMFELSGFGINNVIMSAPAVTYVCLSNNLFDETSALRAHKVLKEFPNMKCLSITSDTLEGLLRWKPMVVSSSFHKLKELEVSYPRYIGDVFLNVFPHLESLVLNLNLPITCTSKSREALSQLKEVKLVNVCCGYPGDIELPMYFLKNVKNLKKMTISLNTDALRKMEMNARGGQQTDQVELIKQSILGLKPKSSSCEIVVVEEKERYFLWAGSWPKVITGDGRATQIVQTVQYRCKF